MRLTADAGLSKADAGKALDATLSAVTGALKGGDSVSLVGFGTFQVKDRAARSGRNPQTGATIQISSQSSGFKAEGAERCRELINERYYNQGPLAPFLNHIVTVQHASKY